MCGLTPTGSAAEAWIVGFRVVQGAGGALMFPAALAIVVNVFPLRERGKALALFFGIAGGLTAIGPILGGYLTQWTWRAIFWVNIPVALIALVLIARVEAEDPVPAGPDRLPRRRPHRGRHRAQHLRPAAVGPVGLEQSLDLDLHHRRARSSSGSSSWSSSAPSRRSSRSRIFRIRAFTVENLVLLIAMMAFIPIFFFASEYAQIALHKTASQAGLFLLFFFLGFVVAAQIGGPHPRPGGSEAGRGHRLCHRRGRLRHLGLQGRRP